MFSVSNSPSSGIEILSSDGLLPANLTTQQLQNASPAQLTQLSVDSVELSTVTALFDGGAASTANSSDSIAATLLGESSNSVNSESNLIDQALETATTNASNTGSSAQTSDSTTNAGTDTNSGATGSLFSYLG